MKLMRLPSYLQISPYGIYYFRSVFPKSVQLLLHKREFRRSLKTTCRRDAVRISRIIKLNLDHIFFKIIREQMDWQQTQLLLDKIAQSIIDDFKRYVSLHGTYPDNIDDYPEKQAEADAHYYLEMKQFPLDHPNIDISDEEIENTYGLDSKPANDIRWRRNGGNLASIDSIRNYAITIINENQLEIDNDDCELFCQKVAEMLWYTKIRREEVIELNQLPNVLLHQPITPLPDCTHHAPSSNATTNTRHRLTDLFEDHVVRIKNENDNNDWDNEPSYRSRFETTYDILKYCMELPKDQVIWVEDITKNHASRLKKIIEKWPLRPNDNFKGMETEDICKLVESNDKSHLSESIKNKLSHTISTATMINYASPIRRTMEQAIDDDGIININVFENFKFKKPKKYRKSREGKPFTTEELELIFGTEIHTKKIFDRPFKYWVPVLLLYSGARLNDICNLKLSDIIEIGDIKCLRIQKSKTDAGKRNVPIHSRLIALGFLNFLNFKKSCGSVYIFDELPEYTTKNGTLVTRGNAVGKWFNIKNEKDTHKGHLNKCGITEKGKRLHSFRNTFINHLKQQQAQVEEVKEVVGHISDDMTFATYAEPYQINILKRVIEQINYRGTKLPWLFNKHYKDIKFPWDK